MRTYEGMFLFDSSEASKDWSRLVKHVESLVEKHGGTIQSHQKWADRKLAYTVARRKRGTYMLVYFSVPPGNVSGLRKDFHLSDVILRHLILTTIYTKPSEKKEGEEAKVAGEAGPEQLPGDEAKKPQDAAEVAAAG